jgi:hypothetical protein
MFDSSSGREPDESRPGSVDQTEKGTPSPEIPWSDLVVGIGYFPAELGLPPGWTWEANKIRP